MNVLKWFNENYQELITDMKNSTHNLSNLELSPFHAEGSVWTHTMMVYSQLLPEASIELKLAALLHDIGKPYCQIKKEGKEQYSFTGHENYSAFLAIDILNVFPEEIDKEIILYALNYHDVLHKAMRHDDNEYIFMPEEERQKINYMFEQKLDLYSFLFDLSYADMRGRISRDMHLSIQKYKILKNFVPYIGTMTYVKKDFDAHILVGLPGSGKTTKKDELIKENPELIYLSIDEEIMNLNKYSYSYDGAWSIKRKKEAANIVFKKMQVCIENNKSFIIDATNVSTKIRRRQLNAISNKFNKIAHVQLAGKEFIEKEMNRRNDKVIDMNIVKSMAKDFSYPTLQEFDIVNTSIIY